MNGDGQVNGLDIVEVQSNFGRTVDTVWHAGDATGDGLVDANDLVTVLQNYRLGEIEDVEQPPLEAKDQFASHASPEQVHLVKPENPVPELVDRRDRQIGVAGVSRNRIVALCLDSE